MNDHQHPATGVTVVTLPAEIDIANAGHVTSQLTAAITGATTVIADLTPTTFCDTSGLRAIIAAHKHAAATGTALHVVIPDPGIARIFTIAGLAGYLAIYPTLTTAQAAAPAPQHPPPR